MKRSYVLLLVVAGFFPAGCSEQSGGPAEPGIPVVCTVNYPLAYFAERIADGRVAVVFPEIEGDPAYWKPSMEELQTFQEAELILLNGADYAKWTPTVSLKQTRLLNCAAGLEDRFVPLTEAATHTHGPGGAHAHGDHAFTLWLNPQLAMHQASIIHAAFEERWAIGREGYEALMQDLKALDESLELAFMSIGNQPLIGSHPVYQYLAQRYALNMKSVHWEPGDIPDAAQWLELDGILELHKAGIMLWEDEPLPEVRARLERMGIESVVFNPCGNRPAEGNFLDVMKKNAAVLKEM